MNPTPNQPKPQQAIVFDFGRTLYDPETDQLIPGATELLSRARERGYICLLLTKAGPDRLEQITNLGLASSFDDIVITAHKTAAVFQDFTTKFNVDLAQSFVIGDRARSELALGTEAGWPTIWFRAGKFKDELPNPSNSPTHVVYSLAEATKLI